MAAPNIINISTVTGKTAFANVTTVSSNALVNSAASGKVLKLNTLIISNVDGTNAADATASILRSGIENKISSTISVPADSSLIVVSKDTPIYLEEGDALRLQASANNDLWAVCSYEDIS